MLDETSSGSIGGESQTVVHLVFVGDVMLARLPGVFMARGGDPFLPFSGFLEGDLVICNLECAVATGGQPVLKPFNFRANPAVVPVVARYFSAVSVANNHSGDFGPDAFLEMLGHLDAKGLPHFGGGVDLSNAHNPLVFQRNNCRIALLGYSEIPPDSFCAGPRTPGVAWSTDQNRVIADIKAAREVHKADLVIPFMHWGVEYHLLATPRQQELARQMIDGGADIIVGCHPHVTERFEIYRGKLIIYSLGNFVFDRMPGLASLGWLLRLSVNKTGLLNWSTLAARIDGCGTPHPDLSTATPRSGI
jgi:poly-gamma-glutamate capsule biosynthesis protein CapA/YwtB (metallophosphatase superfamily)